MVHQSNDGNANERHIELTGINFSLGVVVGVAIGVPLAIITLVYLASGVKQVVVFWTSLLLVAGFVLALLVICRNWILQKLFGTFKTSTEDIARSTIEIVDQLSSTNYAEAKEAAKETVLMVAASYTWVRTRTLVVGWIFLLLTTLLVLVDSMLLHQQNELVRDQRDIANEQTELVAIQTIYMDEQNKLVKAQERFFADQNTIAEAERISNLSTRMYEIIKELAAIAKTKHPGSDRQVRVPTAEQAELVALLTTSFKPVNTGLTIGTKVRQEALSLERGMILSAMLRLNVLTHQFQKAGANFDFADMRDTRMPSDGNIISLSMQGACFDGAKLTNSYWDGADLSTVSFVGANLENSEFNHCELINVSFDGANLRGAWFDENGVFENVTCKGALFSLDSTLVNGGAPDLDHALIEKNFNGKTVSKTDVESWLDDVELWPPKNFSVIEEGKYWRIKAIREPRTGR